MSYSEEALQPNGQAVVRLLEASAQVRRRHQFFGWIQTHWKELLPHAVVSCGTYQRSRRSLTFDLFNSVVLEPLLTAELGDGRSELLRSALDAWVSQRTRAMVLDAAALVATPQLRRAVVDAGLGQMMVHGVSRPQRPSEVESFFVLSEPHRAVGQRELLCLEMLLPCLHATYLRVQATEREMGIKEVGPKPPARSGGRLPLTERERQILACVREGKSNPQIGSMLGISALTAKNHVQNILRKLGAANRAQAVAKAGTLGALQLAATEKAES